MDVLFVVIPVAWLVIVLIGMTMFRLAARSDRAQAAALAEWIAAGGGRPEEPPAPVEMPPEQLPLRVYRAAG